MHEAAPSQPLTFIYTMSLVFTRQYNTTTEMGSSHTQSPTHTEEPYFYCCLRWRLVAWLPRPCVFMRLSR